MTDTASNVIGRNRGPDTDVVSLGTRPSEPLAKLTYELDDAYTFDPASSPKGNRVGREVGIIVFGCFMGLCGITIVWWIIQRLCQWRKDRAMRKSQQKPDKEARAVKDERPSEIFIVDVEKGTITDSLDCSPVASDRSSAYSVPSPDNLYRHDPYSPAATALARSRERRINPVGRNFSRPGLFRSGSVLSNEPARQLVLPPVEVGYRFDMGSRDAETKPIRQSSSYNVMYQHAAYPYGRDIGTGNSARDTTSM